MKKPDFAWDGDWQAPGHGGYVISQDGEEMEPYQVIDLLNKYQDLLEQVKHKQLFRPLPESLLKR